MDSDALGKELHEIISGLPALPPIDSKTPIPASPWSNDPRFLARIEEIHQIVDNIKEGSAFIMISEINGEPRFVAVNMSEIEQLELLSNAIRMKTRKLHKKLDEGKHEH